MPEIRPDFSCYVALGDSVTAGYADGALYREAQLCSWANIVAGQMARAGGGVFRQPLMPADSQGVDPLGNARLVLRRSPRDNGRLQLGTAATQGDVEALKQRVFQALGPFHNFGVPGAKVTTLLAPGFGNPANGPGFYNPFFTRMASDTATASVLSDALAAEPSFFSLFIGNNDVLAYALSGGTLGTVTPNEGGPGTGFGESLELIIRSFRQRGALGVIANLPAIDHVPYFTCVPWNGLWLDADSAQDLNTRYRAAGLELQEGENPFIVQHTADRLRFMERGELVLMDVLLDADADKYLAGTIPLPRHYVLNGADVQLVNRTVQDYNRTIAEAADRHRLAFVDIHNLVKQAVSDRSFNVMTRQLEFRRKGVFSLDGLHPNAFGQALMANAFITSINARYGTTLAPVRPATYPGIAFPD